jgi:hypothetical protein
LVIVNGRVDEVSQNLDATPFTGRSREFPIRMGELVEFGPCLREQRFQMRWDS